MNKIYITSALLFAVFSFGQAGAPAAPYYNNFNFSLTGMPLKNALATKVIGTHSNELTYQQAENAIKIIDLDPDDNTNANVLLVYGFSAALCPSASSSDKDHRRRNKNSDGGGTSCEWNREHTYAKSLGNPDLGESGPGSDAHHLRACDVDRNSDRGSQKFGTGSGNSGDVGADWYPGDEWKGDIARMMMYMYLRYGNQCLPTNVGTGNTVASDSNMIDLFLQWNAEDPVSEVEDQRNTYLGNTSNAYAQGNRNPFIDNPFLATRIWGGVPAENRWPTLAVNNATLDSALSIYPNPSSTGSIHIQTSLTVDKIVLLSITGQVIFEQTGLVSENNLYTLEHLNPGFYMLYVSSGTETVVKKIIIK